jgi:hypothetical protein
MGKPRGIVIAACAWLSAESFSYAAECPRAPAAPNQGPSTGSPLRLFGTLREEQGDKLIITTRNGEQVTVDATPAFSTERSTVLVPGRSLDILGTQGPNGEVRADVIRRAPTAPSAWEADCLPSQ